MSFTPVRLTSPDGLSVLVGSATEREHLITHGYKAAEPAPEVSAVEPEPVADAVAEPKPSRVNVQKPK